MPHHTFDRFQGVWLGGLFGQALVNGNSPGNQLSFNPAPDWIEQRQQLTKILLDSEGTLFDRNEELSQHDATPLSILPWILLSEPDLPATIGGVDANSASPAGEDIAELLIWSRLLSWLLHAPRSPLNVKLLCQKAIASARVSNILTEKLDIAVAAVESGTSLHQLAKKLTSQGNQQQTAIALSYYCFAATPQEFSLSITRAAKLDLELAILTAPLTATLSGAYNGMTTIPGTWRTLANRSSIYRRESKLAVKLFQNWLGLYPTNCQQFGDRELDAVAIPQLIQPRQSLKIISQPRFWLD